MPTVPVNINNADFNAVVEDQRNIVQILSENPNVVRVTVPGLINTYRQSLIYGNGVPWEIEVEI
jgi:hypothetical protein